MDRNVYGGALYARALTLNHKFGKDGLHQILSEMRKTGYTGPVEIADIKPKQRYPVEYLQQMNLAILNEYGEEKFQQIARDAAKRRGIVGVFVKWAASLEMIMERAPEYWSEFYDFGTMKTERTDEGYKLILHDAYVDPLFCKYLTNYYWGILVSAKIKGEIVHNKCQGRGDGHCEWQIITGEQKASQKTHTKEEIKEAENYGRYKTSEVRDAILHCLIDMNMDHDSANIMLKEQFKHAGAPWENPSKKDLQNIIDLLAEEAKNSRDTHTIQANHNKIQKMLKNCDCRESSRAAAQTEEISIEKSTRMQEAKQNTQEPDPAPKKPAPDSECPHLAQCYIFIHGIKDSEDIVYAKIWCTTKDMYPNCMRKQLKEAGREVPKNLLPNGKYR